MDLIFVEVEVELFYGEGRSRGRGRSSTKVEVGIEVDSGFEVWRVHFRAPKNHRLQTFTWLVSKELSVWTDCRSAFLPLLLSLSSSADSHVFYLIVCSWFLVTVCPWSTRTRNTVLLNSSNHLRGKFYIDRVSEGNNSSTGLLVSFACNVICSVIVASVQTIWFEAHSCALNAKCVYCGH